MGEIDMNESVMQVSELAGSSIDLAEKITNYSFWVVFTAASIVVIFLLLSYVVWQLRFVTKSLIVKIDVIHQSAEKVSKYFEKDSFRSVDIDAARALISCQLELSRNSILVFIAKIKQRNHLDDKKAIEEKIDLFLDKAYGINESFLRKFDFQGRALSSFLRVEWKDAVKKKVVKDCDNNTMDCHKIESTYIALFDSFKLEINRKIDDIY